MARLERGSGGGVVTVGGRMSLVYIAELVPDTLVGHLIYLAVR